LRKGEIAMNRHSKSSRRYYFANALSTGTLFKCLITVLILLTFFVVGAGNQPVDTESADALFIDERGNVGIGTNQPTSKLDVKGTVNASRFTGVPPIGTIMAYGGDVSKDEIKRELESQGWLACDGKPVKYDEYRELFRVIGRAFGAPDSLSFNLPDLRGRVAVGAGSGKALKARNLAEKGGEEEHTLTISEMPIHKHTWQGVRADRNDDYGFGGSEKNVHRASGQSVNDVCQNAGQGWPHNNMQPFLVVNYIIYAGRVGSGSADE
jgi:microcystin-dependent protein